MNQPVPGKPQATRPPAGSPAPDTPVSEADLSILAGSLLNSFPPAERSLMLDEFFKIQKAPGSSLEKMEAIVGLIKKYTQKMAPATAADRGLKEVAELIGDNRELQKGVAGKGLEVLMSTAANRVAFEQRLMDDWASRFGSVQAAGMMDELNTRTAPHKMIGTIGSLMTAAGMVLPALGLMNQQKGMELMAMGIDASDTAGKDMRRIRLEVQETGSLAPKDLNRDIDIAPKIAKLAKDANELLPDLLSADELAKASGRAAGAGGRVGNVPLPDSFGVRAPRRNPTVDLDARGTNTAFTARDSLNAVWDAGKTYDPMVLGALASIETGGKFDPGAVSSTGAIGLFQQTQGYAKDNGLRYLKGDVSIPEILSRRRNPYDSANIVAAVMQDRHERFFKDETSQSKIIFGQAMMHTMGEGGYAVHQGLVKNGYGDIPLKDLFGRAKEIEAKLGLKPGNLQDFYEDALQNPYHFSKTEKVNGKDVVVSNGRTMNEVQASMIESMSIGRNRFLKLSQDAGIDIGQKVALNGESKPGLVPASRAPIQQGRRGSGQMDPKEYEKQRSKYRVSDAADHIEPDTQVASVSQVRDVDRAIEMTDAATARGKTRARDTELAALDVTAKAKGGEVRPRADGDVEVQRDFRLARDEPKPKAGGDVYGHNQRAEMHARNDETTKVDNKDKSPKLVVSPLAIYAAAPQPGGSYVS